MKRKSMLQVLVVTALLSWGTVADSHGAMELAGGRAEGAEAVAIGSHAVAYGNKSTVVGYVSTARGEGNMVIGSWSHDSAEAGTDISKNAVIIGRSSTVIGSDRAAAFGAENKVNHSAGSFALGCGVHLKNSISSLGMGEVVNILNSEKGIALGNHAKLTDAAGSTVIGNGSEISSKNTLVLGNGSFVKEKAEHSIVVGSDASVGPKGLLDKVVLQGIVNEARDSVNIADDILVNLGQAGTYSWSTVMGDEAVSRGYMNTVAGAGAIVEGRQSVAVGALSIAKKNLAVSLGNLAETSADKSMAIGAVSKAENVDSVALGVHAVAKVDGGVALGAYSKAAVDKGVYGYDVATGKAITEADILKGKNADDYAGKKSVLDQFTEREKAKIEELNGLLKERSAMAETESKADIDAKIDRAKRDLFDIQGHKATVEAKAKEFTNAWQSNAGAISVGNAETGMTRQITGVSAGFNDTDVVNVAQLKALHTHLKDQFDQYSLKEGWGGLTFSDGKLTLSVENKKGEKVQGIVKIPVNTYKLIKIKGKNGKPAKMMLRDQDGNSHGSFELPSAEDKNTTYTLENSENDDNTTTITFTNNDNEDDKTEFKVATRDTNTYTTGVTYDAATKKLKFTQNDAAKNYEVDLSALTPKAEEGGAHGTIGGASDAKVVTGDTVKKYVDGNKITVVAKENSDIVVTSEKSEKTGTVYTLDVTKDGTIGGDKDTSLVTGATVKTELDKLANANDAYLTPANVKSWQDKLGNGAVADGNTGLVTGGAVKKYVDENKATVTGDDGKGVKIEKQGNDYKVTLGDTLKAGNVTIGGEKGKEAVTGLSNKTWDPNKIESGRAATEDQLKSVDDKVKKADEKAKEAKDAADKAKAEADNAKAEADKASATAKAADGKADKAIADAKAADDKAGKAGEAAKAADTKAQNALEEAKKHTTVVAGDNISVTEKENATGGKEYTVAVKAGAVADSDTGFVTGDTVNKAIKNVAKADAGNLTPENVKAWQGKLGNGAVADNDKGLVTGDAVKKYVDENKSTVTGDADKGIQVTPDGKGYKVTLGDTLKAGNVTIGGEKGKEAVTGLSNKTWDPNKIEAGRAATEDQLKSVDDKVKKADEKAKEAKDAADTAKAEADKASAAAKAADGKADKAIADAKAADDKAVKAGEAAKAADDKATKAAEEAKKHTTVVAGESISVTEKTNENGGKEYTVSAKVGTINGDKDGNLVTGDTVKKYVDENKTSVSGDENKGIKVTKDGNDYKVSLGDTLKAGNVTVGGEKGKEAVTGLSNKTWDPNKIESGRAATEDQLKSVDDKVKKADDKAKEAKDAADTAKAEADKASATAKAADGKADKAIADAKAADDKAGKAGEAAKAADTKAQNALEEAKKHNTVVAGDNISVTEKENATGGKEYTVAVKEGTIDGDKDENLVTGKTVKAELDKLANGADKYLTPENVKAWQGKLGNGAVADGDKGLVTGDAVKKYFDANKTTVTGDDGKGVKIEKTGNDYKVTLGDTLKAGHVTVGGEKGKEAVTGLSNKAWNPEAITSGRAATEDQLKAVDDQVKTAMQGVDSNRRAISLLDTRIGDMNGRMNQVGAGAAALSALQPQDFDPEHKWDISLGYGNYRDAHAMALGAYYRPNEHTLFSLGTSLGGGDNMLNVGVTLKVGRGSFTTASKTVMAREIQDLKLQNEQMAEENKEIKNELEILKAQVAALAARK